MSAIRSCLNNAQCRTACGWRRRCSCWSSAARICPAKALCSVPSASTQYSRSPARPYAPERLTLSRLSVGASIRTTDSLEEGQSRFMAEILRLRQILELPPPALFLLDELLHGTNSHDRAIGAEGVVRALLARGAIGIATTHDLSLATVADQLAPAAANVHFEDRLENGRLVFDYRMRDGVVTRSNALDLMRAAGLDV